MTLPVPQHPTYTITTAGTTVADVHQAAVVQVSTGHTPAPLPGAEVVTLPGGQRVLAYVDPRPAPAPAIPQPIPAWAKGTALVMVSTGTGVGLGSLGLAALLPALTAAAPALAVIGCAIAAGGIGVAALARGARTALDNGTARSPRSQTSGPQVVTATATSTNRSLIGGRPTANATITITK